MPPELLYQIYKYLSIADYIKIKETETPYLSWLVESFREPLEGRLTYMNGKPHEKLMVGLTYIAKIDPLWKWNITINIGFLGRKKKTIQKGLLDYVATNRHIEILKLLLKSDKVDPDEVNSALREAFQMNRCKVVKNLLKDRRSIIQYNDMKSCLQNGYTEIVKTLLQDDRVDPSAADNYAIRYASKNGHREIVKTLLRDDRVDPSAADNYAIRLASQNGYTKIVKTLLQDDRVDPSAADNYAIRYASQNGHTEIVKYLLRDDRVDPSAAENYAIRFASQNGHTEIVKYLLRDDRVDPSAAENYAIRLASRNGYTEIVKYLLRDDRVDPSAAENYAIKSAIRYNNNSAAKVLLQDSRIISVSEASNLIEVAFSSFNMEVFKELWHNKKINETLSLAYKKVVLKHIKNLRLEKWLEID